LPEPRSEFKLVADNRKAFHDFHILDRMEAGMVLTGTEIKSARAGRVQLRDAYAEVIDGEVWLINAHFGPYSHGNIYNHNPLARRKLLLHKSEIKKLAGNTREKGQTLIPLKVYLKGGLLKCELALAKGKKVHDKRAAQIERAQEAEARAAMRNRNIRARSE
jgi:SsrA-binding protein